MSLPSHKLLSRTPLNFLERNGVGWVRNRITEEENIIRKAVYRRNARCVACGGGGQKTTPTEITVGWSLLT